MAQEIHTPEKEEALKKPGSQAVYILDPKTQTVEDSMKLQSHGGEKIGLSVSFKEESNLVADLPDAQKKALSELKEMIQDALNKHEFFPITSSDKETEKKVDKENESKAAGIQDSSDVTVSEKKVTADDSNKAAAVHKDEESKVVGESKKTEEQTVVDEAMKVEDSKLIEQSKIAGQPITAEVSSPVEEQPSKTADIVSSMEQNNKPECAVQAMDQTKKTEEPTDVVEKTEKVDELKEEKVKTVDESEKHEYKTDEKAVPAECDVHVVEKSSAPEENLEKDKKTEVSMPAEAVEEDGEKTVEAIEESVVSVSPVIQPVSAEVVTQEEAQSNAPAEEVSIWDVPLLGEEKSDVILLKFLRARDFKVKEAFAMIKNTVKWRKEFKTESILEEDLGNDLEKAVFLSGTDRSGHPVCYNVYGALQDKELYQNCFGDEEKRNRFLRWRVQFLEKSIKLLDLSPDGVSSIFQVNDLKNSPGLAKKELRQATNQALSLLQDNYPEFVAKQVFINVPWWYLAYNMMISPFLTQRTKSKFVFAGPSKTAETLFKYIKPEQVPVQFGGMMAVDEQEFSIEDAVTDTSVKASGKHVIEFAVSEACTLLWQIRVLGGDVDYAAEFVPCAAESYTVIISKTRKVNPCDEPLIADSFKVGEPGKVLITIDNQSSRKKKLLYRLKTKSLV